MQEVCIELLDTLDKGNKSDAIVNGLMSFQYNKGNMSNDFWNDLKDRPKAAGLLAPFLKLDEKLDLIEEGEGLLKGLEQEIRDANVDVMTFGDGAINQDDRKAVEAQEKLQQKNK